MGIESKSQNIQDYSLKNFRYLVVISLVVILILMGVGLYIVYHDADTIEQHFINEFNEQQLALAKQVALQIEMEIKNIKSELDYLASMDLNSRSSLDVDKIFQAVIKHNQNNGLIETGVFSNNGKVYGNYIDTTFKGIPNSKIPLICNNYPQEMTMTYTRYNMGQSGQQLSCIFWITKIYNTADTVKLYLHYDLKRLIGKVAGEISSGRTGYAWVINEQGWFVYHPHDVYVGEIAYLIRQRYIPDYDLKKINNIMKNDMLAGKYGTNSYHSGTYGELNTSVGKLIAYAPINIDFIQDKKIWSIGVVTPVSEVLEGVLGTTTRHIAAEIAIIVSMFLLGVLIVVYERRMAKYLSRRVTEQKSYLTSILQNTVEAIIMMDKDNKILVWNKGAENIFGYTEKEMIGKTFHRIIPPEVDANQELEKIHEEVATQGYIRNYRALRLTAEGRRITVDLSRTVIRDDEDDIIGSVAIIKDVTREMDVEQRMYNTEKLASIGTLAAGVAHEINNPLAVILGFTDLLKDRFKEGSSELEDLKIIEKNAENAKKTVENLLGFARVSEGEQESVNVNESLQTVISIVESTLIHEKVKLIYEIDENLPDVSGDTREFQQVIFNLINNALAAMKGSEGTLRVSGWVESRRVCVRVTDSGIGIPDLIKPRVFDPFFTTKKVGEGTGLGLSLCYGMIKKYGGSLDFFSHSAEDDPNEPSGSSFTVTMKFAYSYKTEKGV